MIKFKGTKGEWFANKISGIIIGVNAVVDKSNFGVYSQNVCEFILPETDKEYFNEKNEIEANAQLIADAGNTINKCDLMPSELLIQRDELLKELQKVRLDIKLHNSFMEDSPIVRGIDYVISKALGK